MTAIERLDLARLSEIRARAEAATLGPWEVEQDTDVTNRFPRYRLEAADGLLVVGVISHEFECGGRDDADFIASARQDVPDLLAEVDRLTAALDVAEKAIKDAKHEVNGLLDSMDDSVIADEAERLAVYDAILTVWQEIGADYDAAKEALNQ